MTFQQQADAQRIVQLLARMDIPGERSDQSLMDPKDEEDCITRAIDDAAALYDLIIEAREILKGKKR